MFNFKFKSKRLKKYLSIGILGVFIVLSLALVVYPFVPLFSYHIASWTGFGGKVSAEELELYFIEANLEKNSQDKHTGKEYEIKNRIIIPKIGVDIGILGGLNEEYALDKGSWILPETSTPDKGGNTVFSAHRFKYMPPNSETFFLLDKLADGDQIIVLWDGDVYEYRVDNSKIVSPYEIDILDNTEDSQITLFTCNPIFSTSQRLVVKAELVNSTKELVVN